MLLWILTALSIIQLASPTEKRISVQQSPRLTVENNATLFCNYTSKQPLVEFKVLLFKGVERTEEVCSVFWNGTYASRKKTQGFSCDVNVIENEKTVLFELLNLSTIQTDIYTCKFERISPAPHEYSESHGTVIHVRAPGRTCPEIQPEYLIPMATTIGVLVFYSVLITTAFFFCWLKIRRNKIIQNDYLNMIQWQTNGPKKRHPQPGVPARNYTAYRSWEP
ncbi:T-cell-specific surface glycoprotein CD28 [Hemicordylus capensis]|uniref:T-cell-specific surface glycoprotein CD28 n=1 Tax=Hemicordylus capensis TaxID=884348 RepID=UPI002302FA1E|nr:T-cell-specific surface glycoprotein CD28 [Hemicordylus capensis]